MSPFNILMIFIGLVTIIANICIAIYSAGKNRKIYEIENLSNVSEVNKKLESGDYTVLYVGADFKLTDKVIYILGKVGMGRLAMNTNQLIVAWAMGIITAIICLNPAIYRVGSGFDSYLKTDIGRTILYITPVLIIGGLLMYTLRGKKPQIAFYNVVRLVL